MVKRIMDPNGSAEWIRWALGSYGTIQVPMRRRECSYRTRQGVDLGGMEAKNFITTARVDVA